MATRGRQLAIAALSGLGLADSLYMLAYEEGLIDSLVCPFFGEGCNKVGRSQHARHFGVPNAAAGVLGYAAMGGLSLAAPPRRRSWSAFAVAGISTAAAAASVFLTWEQAAKVKAWCFWCLSSAAINAAILPLSLSNLPRRWPSRQGRRT